MKQESIYVERVPSFNTESLFLLLAVLFLGLFYSRVSSIGLDTLAVVYLVLFTFFLFYSINFLFLTIFMTSSSLKLRFGVFSWTVPYENIESAHIDPIPFLMRMGGAGVHFMFIGNRFRVSFNFLEYPRVVIALKRKAGPVKDVSFSTRHPEEILRHLEKIC